MEGLIFDIQRFSVHDGPGIRTTVFLKGCSLQCFWCHNPESINRYPEIELFTAKCISCGRCMEVCPAKAHQLKNGSKVFIREACIGCGKCAQECFAGAIALAGKLVTVEKVMEALEADRLFYNDSKGGITFSGGEPLLQKDFLQELLKECKGKGFHTAVDTAGNVPWENFQGILPYTDLFLYDLKCMDEERHKQAVGTGNKRILDNLQKLSEAGGKIVIRIPVIPGVNSSREEMEAMAACIKGLTAVELVELLTFHKLGGSKYVSLGRQYEAMHLDALGKHAMDEFGSVFSRQGIKVKVS